MRLQSIYTAGSALSVSARALRMNIAPLELDVTTCELASPPHAYSVTATCDGLASTASAPALRAPTAPLQRVEARTLQCLQRGGVLLGGEDPLATYARRAALEGSRARHQRVATGGRRASDLPRYDWSLCRITNWL